MAKISSEKLNKGLFSAYLTKADQFYELMKEAEQRKLWNGVGLNAVHCAISSCDALSVFYLGERSRSQKHEDVAILLRRIELANMAQKIKQVSAILAIKNLVEYEAREFHKDDALKIISQTERLYMWIKDNLMIK